MKTWTVVGYTYQADNYCPDCISVKVAWLTGKPREDYETVEAFLDRSAATLGVDRMDDWTFGSGDFPKVIFADQIKADEYCGTCHLELI